MMNILMLAPEPFFEPRGTPISIYFRLQALSAMGHSVDLITYPLGEDKEFPHVRILRTRNLLGIKKIRIGPSWKKFPLDFLMFLKTSGRLFRRRYDLVFSHEEAAIFGTALARLRRIPHIYDMHSSLPQQLENFQFTSSRFWVGLMRRMERYVLKHSAGVIVICPDLLQQVQKAGWGDKAVLLENFLDFETPEISDETVRQQRSAYAREDEKIVLYAGNFQPYQGIPLLLEAASHMTGDPVVFLLVGDTPEAVADMQAKAQELGISEKVRFTGQVAPQRIPLYLRLADALVSPRLSGTNTPLKIYSFLKSGKPLVATNLWTHSQVLDQRIAFLVEPRARDLADGLRRALFTPEGAARAPAARDLADAAYTENRYQEKLTLVLDKARDKARSKGKNSP
jgi:glycosyltransferase involved in cell wall biosynthesis